MKLEVNTSYHCRTQEDFDSFLVEAEGAGFLWLSGNPPTHKKNYWQDHGEHTYVQIDSGRLLSYYSRPLENLKVIEYKKSNKIIMQKITPMLKRLLDKNSQTLYKAGYINGDLELTDKGRSALNALIFETNKVELVKLAQEDIDEEK